MKTTTYLDEIEADNAKLDRCFDEIAVERDALKSQVAQLEATVAGMSDALKKYATEEQTLGGADYQMYATSSLRQAMDDGGEAARKALAEWERG